MLLPSALFILIVLNIVIIWGHWLKTNDRNEKLKTLRKLTEHTEVCLIRSDQNLISGRGRGVLVVCNHQATMGHYHSYQYQWIDNKWHESSIVLDSTEVYNWFHRKAISTEALSSHDADRLYFILDLIGLIVPCIILIYDYLN